MKVYYDEKHGACAVEFDRDDTIFIYSAGKIEIHSCKGGRPKLIKKQLLFSPGELKAKEKKIPHSFKD